MYIHVHVHVYTCIYIVHVHVFALCMFVQVPLRRGNPHVPEVSALQYSSEDSTGVLVERV